ncbi:MAG TPA: D-aminoacylase [Sandaracinaceae bacterium LLY-WYZ-13_1]|nr:D-aminoacylase [Sandaracinaceae bacterium LLY-WYZ-13_1]
MRRLIENARIVDGTGAPARDGSLLIEDDVLAEVGETSLPPDEVLDAGGAVVAPGFIDMHSHGDFTLPGQPDAEAKVAQGVTTEVVCNCGLGLQPANAQVERFYELLQPMIFGEASGGCFEDLDRYGAALESRGVSVNVACLVPHGNVRCAVVGMEEREATATEIGHMRELVEAEMAQGAFGLSTGLVYPPGAYAGTDEIVELAKVLRPYGGFYATHMRDEGSKVVQSVEEALTIGREARVGVQISHHKAAGRFNWGKTKKTLKMVDDAHAAGLDVHSDVYPYTAGSTVLSAMFVPLWAFEGGQRQLLERLADPATRERIIADSKERLLSFATLPGVLDRIVPKRLLLPLLLRELGKVVVISSTKRQHHYEGKNLLEMAKMRGQDLYEAMLDLLAEEETAVAAIAHVMDERDVQRVMKHPRTMLGTDGFPQREGKPHPRTYGTYPRVLERYVREEGLLTLEEAVHKMTGMVAAKLGVDDRGVLRPGAKADLVVFDPARVRDRSSYADPRRAPEGFAHVFVNGAWTLRDGAHTGARAGRVLRRPKR